VNLKHTAHSHTEIFFTQKQLIYQKCVILQCETDEDKSSHVGSIF